MSLRSHQWPQKYNIQSGEPPDFPLQQPGQRAESIRKPYLYGMWHHLVHNTFFNADLVGGLLFLIMGYYVSRRPPSGMKAIFGYRTVLSTRNADTWKEANLFAARFSIRIGVVLVPLGIIMGILFRKPGQGFYMFTVGSVAVAALMLLGNTEWYLTQTFDDQGIRKFPSR